MKSLYKTSLIILAVMGFAVLLSACGNSKADTQSQHAVYSGKTYNIAIAIDYAPFGYKGDDSSFYGIDVDIINAISENQGVNFNISYVTVGEALSALDTDSADGIMTHMGITEKRKELYDFSDPYFVSGLVAARNKESTFSSMEELKGKRVAVAEKTLGSYYAESISEAYGFTVAGYSNAKDMYNAVSEGKAEACFGGYAETGHIIKNGAPLSMMGEKIIGASYGFAVKKGSNSELLESFNLGLAGIKQSGIYQKIINSYIAEK